MSALRQQLSTGVNSGASRRTDWCKAMDLMLLAAKTSLSCEAPHEEHVHRLTLRSKFAFTTPQVQSLLDGSYLPIVSNDFPLQRALYSSIFLNENQPASPMDFASFLFCINPFTLRSSTATAWFSRTSRVDNLWRKSFLWLRTFSKAIATRILCLLRLLLPRFRRSILRCSRAIFFSDLRRNLGLSIFCPVERTAKCFRPKSTPMVESSEYGAGSGLLIPVSTSKLTKCLPEGSRETVVVFTTPSNRRDRTIDMWPNFGSQTNLRSQSTAADCGSWNDCLEIFFLKAGKSLLFLKNLLYADSRFSSACCNDWAFASRSHKVSGADFKPGSMALSWYRVIEILSLFHASIFCARPQLYTHLQQPKFMASTWDCKAFG